MKRRIVVISVFAGIGGFDLAARWMGWESLIICEIDPMCQQVLRHHFPEAYIHSDIKTLTGETIHHEIEKRLGPGWRASTNLVLCGGFPCQPYSSAGKRLGKADERHLWPEMLRVVCECLPDAVVGENVSGILNWNGGLVFNEVCADLEAEGFDVEAVVLPACSLNAPHRRDRVWFVAKSRHQQPSGRDEPSQGQQHDGRRQPRSQPAPLGGTRPDTDPSVAGLEERLQGRGWSHAAQAAAGLEPEPERPLGPGASPDADIIDGHDAGLRPGWLLIQGQTRLRQRTYSDPACVGVQGDGSPWQQEPQPHAGEGVSECENPGGYWAEWPTVAPVHSGDDGIPDRLDNSRILSGMRGNPREPYKAYNRLNKFGLKASGNAVVPQVVYEVFKALEATWRG